MNLEAERKRPQSFTTTTTVVKGENAEFNEILSKKKKKKEKTNHVRLFPPVCVQQLVGRGSKLK